MKIMKIKQQDGTIVEVPIGKGADGGYYVPNVSQPEAGMMRVSYEASAKGMPAVEPVNIALPKGDPGAPGEPGAPGNDYVLAESDKREIAELAADMVDVPTDDHINNLINTALGVIENGTY